MPRRGASPDQGAAKAGKADKGKAGAKGGKTEGAETPLPPSDPDEKLLFDGYIAAIAAVDKIVSYNTCT